MTGKADLPLIFQVVSEGYVCRGAHWFSSLAWLCRQCRAAFGFESSASSKRFHRPGCQDMSCCVTAVKRMCGGFRTEQVLEAVTQPLQSLRVETGSRLEIMKNRY